MQLRFTLLITVSLIFLQISHAQLAREDVFTASEITFYGLDFSNIQIISLNGFSDASEIRRRYFNRWNRMMIDERDRYHVGKAFQKDYVDYDFSVVNERNKLADTTSLLKEYGEGHEIEAQELIDIIAAYEGRTKEGVGLVFVMDTFNDHLDEGIIWVTFFDMSTKKILLARRMRGRARGMDLLNFWGGTIYDVLQKAKPLFKKWARE